MVQGTIGVDWVQLLSDAGAGAMIIDADGRIAFANVSAARLFARRGPAECVGLRLADVLRPSAADERADLSRRVINSGRPVIFRELWDGVALRATVRKIDQSPSGAPAALWVYAPETDALPQPVDAETMTIDAKHVDYGPLSVLTSSELRVMALIGEGLSNADIAARLHRAVKTVESHRASLTEKTGSASRVELGAMARRAGLIRRVDLPESAPTPGGGKTTPTYYG